MLAEHQFHSAFIILERNPHTLICIEKELEKSLRFFCLFLGFYEENFVVDCIDGKDGLWLIYSDILKECTFVIRMGLKGVSRVKDPTDKIFIKLFR